MPVVFAFDIGTGSLAGVIRQDLRFIYHKSVLLDPEFASTAKSATRRRMARTRLAHRAREFWWNEMALKLGIPVLKVMERQGQNDFRVTSVDPRLLREFPTAADETIYTSSLLRIKILEGGVDQLADWQIYKAIHSAIQKRGYDPDLPWKNSNGKSTDDETDDKEENDSADAFSRKLMDLNFDKSQMFGCYFDAYMMGLWSPSQGITATRVTHKAKAAELSQGKGYTAPRSMVTNELKLLLEKIKIRYPQLDVDYILFGPGNAPYASFNPKNTAGLKRGKVSDWYGLVGQKIPRFDNRIIDKCLLIPRLNVSKASSANGTPHQDYLDFHLLSRLHALQIKVVSTHEIRKINHRELIHLYETFKDQKSISASKLSKCMVNDLGIDFALAPYKIEAAVTTGRTSFCRPAIKMVNRILREGLTPELAYERFLDDPCAPGATVAVRQNKDPNRGLVSTDLDWLKNIFGQPWDKFYLSPAKYDQFFHYQDRDLAIRKVIGSVNNPVVRHRLTLFTKTLAEMTDKMRHLIKSETPDYVTLELVRDDFLGEEAKKRLQKSQRERRETNESADQKCSELGIDGKDARLKFKLFERQKGIDPYTGLNIAPTEISNCEIDHIVPKESGGPDAFYNLVLTSRSANLDKGRRTPHEWLSHDAKRWNELTAIVLDSKMPQKTKKLMISPEAHELVEKYTNLAETAYMAKLLSTIVHIYFGWKPGAANEKKRVWTINGGLTAAIRHRYHLNYLLGPDGEKNRKDPRHHFLDAMVISFLPEWARSPDKRGFFKFPEGVHADFFKPYISAHIPKKIAPKSELEENFYGRKSDSAFRRYTIRDLGYKQVNMKRVFSSETLNKSLAEIEGSGDPQIFHALANIRDAISTSDKPESEWIRLVSSMRLPNGTCPKRIKMSMNLASEMKVLERTKFTGEQILKPKGSHKGFFIALDGRTYKAFPWYAHQSKPEVLSTLSASGLKAAFLVKSGSAIRVKESFEKVPAGLYRLATIQNGTHAFILPFESLDKGPKKIGMSVNKLVSLGKMEPYTEPQE